MPRVSLTTDIIIPVTVSVEALVEFGADDNTWTVSEFQVTGIDGVSAKIVVPPFGFAMVHNIGAAPLFGPEICEAVLPLVEDLLAEEARS